MADKKEIYQTLRYSIRKINEDEIEIRHSMLDGYGRGLIRMLLIGILLTDIYADVFKFNRPAFTHMHRQIQSIQDDFTWAFNPDKEIKPMYKKYHKTVTSPNTMFPNEKVNTYEEYKSDWTSDIIKSRFLVFFHFIWIPLLLLLIFLPTPRGLRLNRKHRMIYTAFATAPVPDKGDPLSGLIYDRFGLYLFGKSGLFGLFGGLEHFSLAITPPSTKIKPITQQFGVYPTPNKHHNLHLVKAMREYFNEENPEFLKYIKPKYRLPMPWRHLMIFFCNVFSLPSFFGSRKMRARALTRLTDEWTNLSEEQKQACLDKTAREQQLLNEERRAYGFNNEVNADWGETDNSPIAFIRRK